MSLTKNVNGVDVELTPEEEAETRAMWAANAPVAPILDDLKAKKLADINDMLTQKTAVLTKGYPEAEQKTWPSQQTEALAWQADDTSPTPYLDGIAVKRDIDPADMRQRTLNQVLLFMQVSQDLVGTCQKLRDDIEAAESEADLDLIVWPTE